MVGARRVPLSTVRNTWRTVLLVCTLCPVTVIDVSELEENQVSEDTVQSWCVEEQAMDMDIGVLQQVEELEHKVTSASLQVKVGNMDFNEHYYTYLIFMSVPLYVF